MKWCAPDVTSTIRPCAPLDAAVRTISSSSACARKKCPRWFTPKCVSRPSRVLPKGWHTTPAQQTSPVSGSARAQNSAANDSTEAFEPRSRLPITTRASEGVVCRFEPVPAISSRIFALSASPFSWERHASTTRAPRKASTRVTSEPSAPVAPVTMYVKPVKSRPSVMVSAVLFALNANTSSWSAVARPSEAASALRHPNAPVSHVMPDRTRRDVFAGREPATRAPLRRRDAV